MPKPFGSQKNFDKNHDGRLSSGEWFNWYSDKYGVDLENQERQKVSSEVSEWESWLNWANYCVETNRNRFFEGTKKLISPWTAETQLLAEKSYIGWITTGLSAGNVLETVLKTSGAGTFYPNKSFHPYSRLLEELAGKYEHICSFNELKEAASSKRALFSSACHLDLNGYGTFWDRLFSVLPPYEEGVLHSAACNAYKTVPELEPVRDLAEGLFISAVLFTGKSGADKDSFIDGYQDIFKEHWKARCGTKQEVIRESIQDFAEKVNSLIASLGQPVADYGYEKIECMTTEELSDYSRRAEDLRQSLLLIEPEDMDTEEWQQWSEIEDQLFDLQDYAEERKIDLEMENNEIIPKNRDSSIQENSHKKNNLEPDLSQTSQSFEREIFLYGADVVGTNYIREIEIIAKDLEMGEKVFLVREPDNEADSRAIAVRDKEGRKMG